PVREGIETALIVQDSLKKIGVQITLDVVEPAVFYASVKKGKFQLYSGRWVGVPDGSIFLKTLRSGQTDNRVGYSDPEMDAWLDQASSEMYTVRRIELMKKVQIKMGQDLPYFPLWYWNNALILRKDLGGIQASELSRSGSFEPLSAVRFK